VSHTDSRFLTGLSARFGMTMWGVSVLNFGTAEAMPELSSLRPVSLRLRRDSGLPILPGGRGNVLRR